MPDANNVSGISYYLSAGACCTSDAARCFLHYLFVNHEQLNVRGIIFLISIATLGVLRRFELKGMGIWDFSQRCLVKRM